MTDNGLTLTDVKRFLTGQPRVVLTPAARRKMGAARRFVESVIRSDQRYYGINTGLGKLATTSVPADQLAALQENTAYSHAMAVGEPLPERLARLVVLLHAAGLAQGVSGVRVAIVERLLALLNHRITPVIPRQGSLGASGDLALLGHLALCVMGKGEVFDRGRRVPAARALRRVGLTPIRLAAKEGLSLVNGLAASLAWALDGLMRAEYLIKLADVTAAMSVEGDQASFQPFAAPVLRHKPHPGVLATGRNLRNLLSGSAINLQHAHCSRVQDPYSFRCVPQVHGAVKETWRFARSMLERELRAVTDNPLVFPAMGRPDSGRIISGGNFHGEAIAFAADFLSIALTELGALAERRLSVLINPLYGEIPTTFLTTDPGCQSGLMVAHCMVTNLALENKGLSHPASVDSLPTSGNQEDHVSQSCWAGQKFGTITANVEKILAVELWAACRALQFIANGNRPGKGVRAVWAHCAQRLPKSLADRYLRAGLEAMLAEVAAGTPVRVAEAAVGPLRV